MTSPSIIGVVGSAVLSIVGGSGLMGVIFRSMMGLTPSMMLGMGGVTFPSMMGNSGLIPSLMGLLGGGLMGAFSPSMMMGGFGLTRAFAMSMTSPSIIGVVGSVVPSIVGGSGLMG